MGNARRAGSCLILLAALWASGCEILAPPPRALVSQLDYLPRIRENLQIVVRWWPLLVADPNAWDLSTGTLPITLPSEFPAGISTPDDVTAIVVPPQALTCATNCRLAWHGQFHQLPFTGTATVAPSGRLLHAQFDVTSESYGTWRTTIGADGVTRATELINLTLQPLAAWHHACDVSGACTFQASYRVGLDATGTSWRGTHTAELVTNDWGQRFPWRAYPETATLRYDGGWRQSIAFHGGESVTMALDRAGLSWTRNGPADLAATGHMSGDGKRWQAVAVYPPDQVLHEWRMTAATTAPQALTLAATFAVDESRATRQGGRRTIAVTGQRQSRALMALRWRDDDSDGALQFRRDDAGWRFDGYWATEHGSLMTVSGHAYATGLWLGDAEGWRPVDDRDPSESAEWVMLPDGTFATLLLFRQEDGTFVDLQTYSPSEGSAPALFK